MFDAILKKFNLCRVEELENCNKTISAQRDMLAESNKRIADLKDQLKFSHKQNTGLESKIEEYLSDIKARDEEITNLKDKLSEINHNYATLQSVEASKSKQLEELDASLRVYKDAETDGRIVVNPCKLGSAVYWVVREFDTEVKPHAIEFDENLGYAIIKLFVEAIITDINGTVIRMNSSQYIETSFDMKDFGKCLFINIEDARNAFNEIVENSTPVKGRRKKSPSKAKIKCIEASDSNEESIAVESCKPVETPRELIGQSFEEDLNMIGELSEANEDQHENIRGNDRDIMIGDDEEHIGTILPEE